MPFIDQASLALHPHFRQRTQVAVTQVAVTVAMESASGDQRVDQLRKDLATRTLNAPDDHVNRWAWALASLGDVSYGSPDDQLINYVTVGWNAMAGV